MHSAHLRPWTSLLIGLVVSIASAGELERLRYRHPGLVVDLGVGLWAWPLPMDYDDDGDLDLVVACPDVPYNGLYLFENPDGKAKMPVFRPPVRLDRAVGNVQVCYVDGMPRVLSPGTEYEDFRRQHFASPRALETPPSFPPGRVVRANQWKYCDYDADGHLDLIVGIGDWSDYGWDNAYDGRGQWTNGPLHGYVYLLRNEGSNQHPDYADPLRLEAGGKAIDVFGMPSPNLADFDGDGDLDLVCGEFMDQFTYFENVGTRRQPVWAEARRLVYDGQPLRMELQMITPSAVDWDKDGDVDLIVGDEDGRVALVEHTGRVKDGLPQLLPPRYFQQHANEVKFGALVTPCSVDWDGDGDEDLICGNTAGYIGFIENLDGGDPPRWAAPVRMWAGGEVLRIQAGNSGSIQGPCESKWGYTTVSVADWDHDGLADVVANTIWGKVIWFRNLGDRGEPKLAVAEPVRVAWPGEPPKPAWNWWDPKPGELVTQWRTTPCVYDWNQDGINDLVMLDHEGYLALFPRERVGEQLLLRPPQRIFRAYDQHTFDARHGGQPDGEGMLRLNSGVAGRSGRRKLCIADWDQDGRPDLLVNSVNVNWLRNLGETEAGGAWFRDRGSLVARRLAGHTTSPTVVDWNRDDRPDLLIGGEDGRLYYWRNVR